MKKSLLMVLLGSIFLLNTSPVFAGDNGGTYLKVGAGVFVLEDSAFEIEDIDFGDLTFETGYNLHGAVGTKFSNGLAVELELAYKDTDTDQYELAGMAVDIEGEISITTLMVNGIYNLDNSTLFTPYAGLGIGIGWIESGGVDNTNFAFQVLAGVETEISSNLSLLTGYRYLTVGEFEDNLYGYDLALDIDTHNFEAAIKYTF